MDNCEELPREKICDLTNRLHVSCESFSSLMDVLNWNSVIRGELKETVELHRSPFGTPAEHACQHILELSLEISRCDKLSQAMQKTDQYLLALNSNYYSCCYHVIAIQWLASLFCFSTSFDSTLFDLRKHTDTLRYIIQQKRDEIVKSYSHIAEIVGPDILQKLVPLQYPIGTETPSIQQQLNPLLPLFNALLIQLLAVTTLGPESLNLIGQCQPHASR